MAMRWRAVFDRFGKKQFVRAVPSSSVDPVACASGWGLCETRVSAERRILSKNANICMLFDEHINDGDIDRLEPQIIVNLFRVPPNKKHIVFCTLVKHALYQRESR